MWRYTYLMLPTLALLAPMTRAAGEEMKPRAVLKEHAEQVVCLAFSPDGKTLASGGRGYDTNTRTRWGEMRLWDVASGKELAILKGHRDGLLGLAFSPDGRLVASASSDGVLRLWEVASGKEVAGLKGFFDHERIDLSFSPDGKRLGAIGQQVAKVYEVPGGKEVASITRGVRGGGTFSPDLKTLAWANYQDVDLWDVAKGQERLTLEDHRGRTFAPSFTADGKTVAVPSLRRFDGEQYAGEVKFWDVATGRERSTIAGRADYLCALALSPEGKRIALITAKKSPAGVAELRLLDVGTGGLLRSFRFKEGQGPRVLAFSPDGRVLAGAGSRDGTVWLWDLARPQ